MDCSTVKNDLRQLDEKIATLNGDVNRMKSENVQLDQQLRGSQNKISTSELEEKIKDLSQEVNELNKRVSGLKTTSTKLISKEEKNKVRRCLSYK